MEHKYGNAVLGMMRSGRLPDLTVYYGQGKAPDPQSCQNCMQMLYHEQAMANAPQKAAPTGGKAGGFLKNLFKLYQMDEDELTFGLVPSKNDMDDFE